MSELTEENLFILSPDITDSPKRPRYTNTWSIEEQNEKLQGYLEIPYIYWPNIKNSTHIRYITLDNEYKPGGFVVKNPFYFNSSDENTDLKPSIEMISDNTTKKIGFKLQNFFNRRSADYAIWIVAYEDIQKVYIKVDAGTHTIIQSLETTIESINLNMKKITDYIKYIDERLKKLEKK